LTEVIAGLAEPLVTDAATLAVDFGEVPVLGVEREDAVACTGALEVFEDFDEDELLAVALVAAIGDAALTEPRGATALTVSLPVERPGLDAAPAALVPAAAARVAPSAFDAALEAVSGADFFATLGAAFCVAFGAAFCVAFGAAFCVAFGAAFCVALEPVFVTVLEPALARAAPGRGAAFATAMASDPTAALEAGFRAVAIVAAGRLGLVLAWLTTGPRYVNRENLLFYQVPSGDVRAFRSARSSA
jgi:hypothetical protein